MCGNGTLYTDMLRTYVICKAKYKYFWNSDQLANIGSPVIRTLSQALMGRVYIFATVTHQQTLTTTKTHSMARHCYSVFRTNNICTLPTTQCHSIVLSLRLNCNFHNNYRILNWFVSCNLQCKAEIAFTFLSLAKKYWHNSRFGLMARDREWRSSLWKETAQWPCAIAQYVTVVLSSRLNGFDRIRSTMSVG